MESIFPLLSWNHLGYGSCVPRCCEGDTASETHSTTCRTRCEMKMQDSLIQNKHSQMVTAEHEPMLKFQKPQNPAVLPSSSSLLSKSVILDTKTHQQAETLLDHDQVSSAISSLDLVPPRTAEAY